ncbi:1-acyl-sn-glycerol-3-phosphate acyltransferase [Apilactobacillus kunkeei]|uniref:1-acyl-sn-glycerol-3-phosphate acyltransferase n=1 Tax=Apilactobacillus kunkeei TaxID=148814 RepID=A0A0C3A3K4_9LACO|nr:1-acyl-sn-glycerol-3-phosphate acyltransferase [Apilactobacillus kunkeei]MBI0090998.1 1-acyl-sn-glycerol-3-phosphate acyltransferase [Lactobacillus sp. M0345]KIM19250.1 acyl-phosphate glycerol 3-phosphate acyltransferase [Apilactobacillus kunkeei]KOY74285.1 1-acyl-sn-glycerol-3-phosphate acyltransferase [Apilactobacillus kunkeei]MBX8455725.1 1-acyl-sn-glycerol-3-phosphate acyltransferase [Apilactobacillus kunkeei]MCX0325139.1 1-acyl-sn-glycerol-3-phosphate acyltransferase [Apilactobacillus 
MYSFLKFLCRIILYPINGMPKFENKQRIPEGNYILVAPHRTWFDPLYFALAASPKEFAFIAKKELFKNPLLAYVLRHANVLSVDRENPGPSVIKEPVKILQNTDKSLIIFPSGTRHSQALKGGATLIAKLSKAPLLPAVYQGPLTFKSLFSRKKAVINFGDPIYLDKSIKLNEEGQKAVEQQMQDAFDKLDKEINPDFKYVDPSSEK